MDSASSRLHYAETYLKRSSDSSRTLQLYVNGALRVLEAERLGVQDAAALAAAAEWEAAGAALEAALRQLQRLLQGISADDGLRPSLERDWACKRRIVEAVTDLCRGPDARAALVVVISVWAESVHVDRRQLETHQLRALTAHDTLNRRDGPSRQRQHTLDTSSPSAKPTAESPALTYLRGT
ncbi:hypothetical protein CDCA_CDCA10G3042 [Cyanidium caldarium]|uniref:Uncharacterized protein n=1 Tax=Cyanidium caldarium TaxID=2771 RepID=A0AAV9IXG0_CYACA|nr:hypothetical protein CDCA_CDCA10G3042 [Cyanidium caldarium]